MVSVALIIGAVILTTSIQTAAQKNFWGDEQYEAVILCDYSYWEILLGKTKQANKNPLYFLVQKFSLSQIDSFDPHILVQARLTSIFSAVFLCLILFFFIYARLGLSVAVLFAVSVTSQGLFYQYSAESRPYLFWLLLFTLLVTATLKLCSQSFEQSSSMDKIRFSLSSLAITLVISFGIIQSLAALLSCLLCWCFIHERPKNLKPLIRFALSLFLACLLIQVYFSLQGLQGGTHNILESQFDLINQIKKGNLSLLKMPVRLLLPKPGRDSYYGAYLTNIFVLIGLTVPFLKWHKRKNLNEKNIFVFLLSFITIGQLFAAIGIGLFIALFHYWFVQRIFLYLIICHALLVTAGSYFLLSLKARIFNPFVKGVVVILVCLSLHWHWQNYSVLNDRDLLLSCEQSEETLDQSWQILDSAWKKLASKSIQEGTPKNYADVHLEYMVQRNQRMKDCGWFQDPRQNNISMCRVLVGELSLDPKSGTMKWAPPVYFRSMN